MQPKARITVRFDPPPQSPNRARISQDSDTPQVPQAANAAQAAQALSAVQTPQARAPKSSPIPDMSAYEDKQTQDDAGLLEQLIRRTNQPSVPEERDRIVRESYTEASTMPKNGQAPEPNRELEIEGELIRIGGAREGIRYQEGGPSWWKVFVSAAGAIVTGALFGYLVLTLFSGGSPLAAPVAGNGANPADAGQAVAAQVKPGAGDANPVQEQASAGTDAVDEPWPGATYYWLQFGVFRSTEAMDAAVQELRDAGLPGWGDDSDGYRVFAGVATDKSEAGRLAAQMPGREVFIKSIRVEDGAGSAELLPFIRDSRQLAAMLSHLSVAALQDKMPEPIAPDELTELRDGYEQWRASAAAVERLQAGEQRAARSMVEAFDAAMASIDQYERKVSRYHLWNIQADLMKVLSAERKLREAFAASSA